MRFVGFSPKLVYQHLFEKEYHMGAKQFYQQKLSFNDQETSLHIEKAQVEKPRLERLETI